MRNISKTCGRSIVAGLATTAALLIASVSVVQAQDGNGECKYRVGFAEPNAAQELDQIYDVALVEAGKHKGICVTIVDATHDVNKQLQAVNQFVAQQMDAIIVFPLSPDSLNAALNRARDAGIKVIGFSATVADGQPTGSIAPYDALYEQNSSVHGAHLLSEYVKSRLPDGGNVLGIGLGFPVPSLKFMVANYEKEMTEGGKFKWLATVDNPSDDIAGGQRVVNEALTRFQGTKISAVMSYNTSSAVGAYNAMRSAGRTGEAVIVGQNGDKIGIEALEKGYMDAVVDLVPWRSSLMLIDLTEKVLTGQSYPPLTFGRAEIYTKDTLSKRLDWYAAVDKIVSGELTCANGGCPTGEEALKPF